MSYRKKKSKPQSTGSSIDKLLEWKFFLDQSFGGVNVASDLRKAGFQVETLKDHFKQNVGDELWLKKSADELWVVLTRDKKFRHGKPEFKLFYRYKIRCFVLTSRKSKRPEIVSIIFAAAAKMREILESYTESFIATISKGANVAIIYSKDNPP